MSNLKDFGLCGFSIMADMYYLIIDLYIIAYLYWLTDISDCFLWILSVEVELYILSCSNGFIIWWPNGTYKTHLYLGFMHCFSINYSDDFQKRYRFYPFSSLISIINYLGRRMHHLWCKELLDTSTSSVIRHWTHINMNRRCLFWPKRMSLLFLSMILALIHPANHFSKTFGGWGNEHGNYHCVHERQADIRVRLRHQLTVMTADRFLVNSLRIVKIIGCKISL